MKLTVAGVWFLGVLAMGCGASVESSSEELTYSFKVNGCDTGEQKFRSKEDYCQGLRDEARNRGCARQLREDAFRARCQG
jgi:hypothetical protein